MQKLYRMGSSSLRIAIIPGLGVARDEKCSLNRFHMQRTNQSSDESEVLIMKKRIVWLLALMLVWTMAAACAEETFFAQFEGVEFSFNSGAGAWSTDLRILPDGSFSGEFHDSDMGDAEDTYPDGTVYFCSFAGRMSVVEQMDENTWKIRVDSLVWEESPVREMIEDGIRFVYTDPYGVSEGDEMLLYRPGTPVDVLTEEMQIWAHLYDGGEMPSALETWFLYSEKNDSGFVSYTISTGVANPWTDLTREDLQMLTGTAYTLPEGADNVAWRWLGAEAMAEIRFTWNGADFCFRSQVIRLEKDELADISGMYYAWGHEEKVTVNGCSGMIGQAQDGTGEWVERCLWYNDANATMYSLSVAAADLDGLDLTAVAGQICTY